MQFRDDVSSESGKNFLKLKNDKDSAVGIFRGNPHDFRQHWIKNGQNNTSKECKGDGCEYCQQGIKSVFRFRINFVMYDSQQGYFSKVFEQGLTVYETLRGLHQGGYDLEKTLVKITRNGTGNNTTYLIMPVPNGVDLLTPQKLQMVAQVQLHDVSKIDEPTQSTSGEFSSMSESDIPF